MNPAPPVAAQLATLPTLPMTELWALWDAHFPRRPASWNRDYLAARLAHRIQERVLGAMDADLRARLLRMGQSQSVFGKRRPELHLMPGTVLLRDYGDTQHRVTVTPAGLYELNGKTFKSLSAVARHITGVNWSGPAFFGVKGKGVPK
jgi:hypothetical protein